MQSEKVDSPSAYGMEKMRLRLAAEGYSSMESSDSMDSAGRGCSVYALVDTSPKEVHMKTTLIF